MCVWVCLYVCVIVKKGLSGILGLLKGVYLVYSNYCKINIVSIDIFVAFKLDIWEVGKWVKLVENSQINVIFSLFGLNNKFMSINYGFHS